MSIPSYQPPANLMSIGKYLIPADAWKPRRGRAPAPSGLVSIRELAAEHPDAVTLTELGAEEALSRFDFQCYTNGVQETDCVLARTAPPAYAALLKGARSFGRHCTIIGPRNRVVRESAYFLDPQDMDAKALLGRYGWRHWRYRQQVDITSRRRLSPPQRVEGRVAALNMRCSHNYFHWLTEILPRLVTLERAGMSCDYYLVDCHTAFQRSVLLALGLTSEQLIQPHCQLLLEADEIALPSPASPACLRSFGARATAALGVASTEKPHRRIYISRRKAGTRRLANEDALQELLEKRGFETHCFEDYDLRQQATLIHEAKAVVATHGAGLANLIFARPDLQVVEIVPDGRYNPTCYPEISRIFKLRHQILFAQRARHKQILTVSLDDANAALDGALSRRRRAA